MLGAKSIEKDQSVDEFKKRLSVSSKRQITIPLKYFKKLNIGNELDCVLKDGQIILTPIEKDDRTPEIILREIISEGFNGEELLKEFIKRRSGNSQELDIDSMIFSEKSLSAWNDPREEDAWESLLGEK